MEEGGGPGEAMLSLPSLWGPGDVASKLPSLGDEGEASKGMLWGVAMTVIFLGGLTVWGITGVFSRACVSPPGTPPAV